MKRLTAIVLVLALLGATCFVYSVYYGRLALRLTDWPAPPPWAKVAPEQIAAAGKHGVPVAFENKLGMRFVLIPAGTFLMGSPEDEAPQFPGETQKRVAVTEPFYIQVTEVTNRQFRHFRPDHDSGTHKGLSLNADLQPVVRVGWGDGDEFAAWLSVHDVLRSYNLPTEIQWEYACRAGTTSAYWWGDDAEGAVGRANVADASTVKLWPPDTVEEGDAISGDDSHTVSAPVGSFTANRWMLHDLIGNVSEWCAAGAAPVRGEDSRPLRGGSWRSGPQLMRCAVPPRFGTGYATDSWGFRLVSPLPESSK